MADCTIKALKQRLLQCAGVILLVAGAPQGDGGLSYDYHRQSCPGLEATVKKATLPVLIADPRSPAAVLRLFFHDCQVQGCDASILLDSDDSRGIASEMESTRNFGIIGVVKSIVEAACPGQVSCADIIVLAAREAVVRSGGPWIAVPLGRKDSTTASNRRADEFLPSSSIGVDGALQMFMSKGMSVEESVAILGAHTIGAGHFLNMVRRSLYNSKMDDENTDPRFEALLGLKCPTQGPPTNHTVILNDLTTLLFDNQYYKDATNGRGLFTIDAAISTDPRTASYVKLFAEDQRYFFRVFSLAFVKLSSAVVLTGEEGEVRRRCNQVN
ncbi:Peroxidase 29 [Cocos nucifera]|uniref:Peroxidase n=1 Tax=Cocos nucifera TaxID=13894 RepID=A0A8K0I2N3_COCNU|nr:Peroxidase 29 [Cocos nucifera]